MSSENTPILAATVPAFELFVSAWETMTADPDLALEDVASIISPGLNIAKNYYRKLDDSDAYVISMCACSCWSHMCSTDPTKSSTPQFAWNGSRGTGHGPIRPKHERLFWKRYPTHPG
jgi:hypothetical protein